MELLSVREDRLHDSLENRLRNVHLFSLIRDSLSDRNQTAEIALGDSQIQESTKSWRDRLVE